MSRRRPQPALNSPVLDAQRRDAMLNGLTFNDLTPFRRQPSADRRPQTVKAGLGAEGQRPAGMTGSSLVPRSASSHSRHSTVSRTAPRPANNRVTTPPGALVSVNSTPINSIAAAEFDISTLRDCT